MTDIAHGSVAVGLARHCPVPLVIVPLGLATISDAIASYPGCPSLGTDQEDHHQAHYPGNAPVQARRGLTRR